MPDKKILLLTDWYEPGYKAGGPIQSCRNLVRALKEDYRFNILTSDRDLGETAAYPGIATNEWTTTGNGVPVWYASPGRMTRELVKRLVRELEPDIIYFNSMFSLLYTLMPLWVLKTTRYKGKIIVAPRGMLHQGAVKQKALKKKVFLKLMSTTGMANRIHFHATDEQEVKDIRQYFKKNAGITQVANIPAMDPETWQPRRKQPGELKMVFVSRIHPKKNLHIALECLQQLPGTCTVSFDIYGTVEDESYLERCQKLANAMSGNIDVQFRGALGRDALFPQLRQYHLFFLPTLGENFGHAIFEALSAGCPVLISDQTPWQDLEMTSAGKALSLQDKKAFENSLEEFCNMPQETFDHWSKQAQAYASRYVEQSDVRENYMQLFG